MIIPLWFWRPWWLPTEDDREKWRKEDEVRAIKEVPILSKEFLELQESGAKLEEKLLKSFSDEQYKLWLELKSNHQKQLFAKTRLDLQSKKLPLFSDHKNDNL